MIMEFIRLPIDQLVIEPMTCSGKDRFSHPAFTRKLPKGVTPCDYDKKEKLIELEYPNGDKHWFELSTFFGKVIAEVKSIYLLHPDKSIEDLMIVGFEVFKEKRTIYWKLIFERELPF